MDIILKPISKLVFQLNRVWSFLLRKHQKNQISKIGKNVYIGKNCILTPKNISIGDDVYIGALCCLQSAHGKIKIGNHIMFGPGVHIHGGNHQYNQIGLFMNEAHDKELNSDGEVIIEDDVWIGSNAIILKGVTVGEGSIIAAGAVVVKDIEPYSIVVGNPARVIKKRFNEKELEMHKKIISNRV